jgi:hypothetical protein
VSSVAPAKPKLLWITSFSRRRPPCAISAPWTSPESARIYKPFSLPQCRSISYYSCMTDEEKVRFMEAKTFSENLSSERR